MATPTIPLPEPGSQSPDDYLQISRRFIEHAWLELEAGHRLQASEKVSGSVATALKAIAQQRGWRHGSHDLRDAVVSQLGAERGPATPSAQTLYVGKAVAKEQHDNFFENVLFEEQLPHAIEAAQALVDVIEQLMNEPSRPFTVSTHSQRHRIFQLTGYTTDIGATDAQGFANFEGVVRER